MYGALEFKEATAQLLKGKECGTCTEDVKKNLFMHRVWAPSFSHGVWTKVASIMNSEPLSGLEGSDIHLAGFMELTPDTV